MKKVKAFSDDIRKKGIRLRYVILFGSYARNEQHRYSDIDVALVADEFIGVGFEDVKQFADVQLKKPYVMIEPHTFNTAYFEKGDPFIEEIKQTGIMVQ